MIHSTEPVDNATPLDDISGLKLPKNRVYTLKEIYEAEAVNIALATLNFLEDDIMLSFANAMMDESLKGVGHHNNHHLAHQRSEGQESVITSLSTTARGTTPFWFLGKILFMCNDG